MKTVPADLLKNYESEVLRKIKSTPAVPYGLFFSAAFAGAILMALGTWVYIAKIQPARHTAEPIMEEMAFKDREPVLNEIFQTTPSVPTVETKQAEPTPPSKEDSEEFREIADDLFILEMLGEDVEVLDGMQRAASDIELAGQFGTVAF